MCINKFSVATEPETSIYEVVVGQMQQISLDIRMMTAILKSVCLCLLTGIVVQCSVPFYCPQVPECAVLQPGHGLIIPCLIEHSESVASVSCRSFLKRMATIVFSDYRLMYKFGERCQQDIVRFKCGRLATSLDDNEAGG